MLIDRLRIRWKLAVLVGIPLVVMVLLAGPIVAERMKQADRAEATAESVRIASQIGLLTQDLQQERLLAVGHLANAVERNRLVLQFSAVNDRAVDVQNDLGADLPAEVAEAIRGVQAVVDVRAAVLARAIPADQVIVGYATVIRSLLASLNLVDVVDSATGEGRQVVALDALLRANEASDAAAAYLVVLAATRTQAAVTGFITEQAVLGSETARFIPLATPTQISLQQMVSDAFTVRFGSAVPRWPTQTVDAIPMDRLFPSMESFVALDRVAEQRIVADVTAAVTERRNAALLGVYGVSSGVFAILLLVVALVIVVARAVDRPLTRLTTSAARVAGVAEAELVRVADDETESVVRIHLDQLDVHARDEIGDLARAFERVQGTAALLVERQAVSRHNVAEMFWHIGRRTQTLVSRQVALIDELEHDETDPGRLQQLYRLDHLSNRLLRNASSLVVLSGAHGADAHVEPLPLEDAVRLALAKIEDYTRVDTTIPSDIELTPAIIPDLVLVLAELMENATNLSPPHTRVSVAATASPAGARITIVDHGIGLSEERLAEENARIQRRERLDLAPTRVLGLFVVGRLARRHGLGIKLSATDGGGVTATVDVPQQLVTRVTVQTSARPADGDVLQRLRAVMDGGSWNGFAVSHQPAIAAAAPVAAALPAAPKAVATARAGSAVAAPRSVSGLRQRVPGAQVIQGSPRPQQPPRSEEPVRQAPPDRPVAAAALKRRVPGATLEGDSLPLQRPPDETAAPASPDEVRQLVEQFQLGVTRARTDAGPVHQSRERTEQ
ncbi:histidine kinase [Actinoplanes sp. ATCC 53533]|uniref:sensor histidine kinase n=1 Tax=Actinoplanes sp. ATCC 53533 TaxID=1288362 RepID=UPI000F76D050|nr:nitrate- and nitrite sensing domain-containing protein [Actinoplanes sp. ATCC 53533]RSM72695.1 histidine kinase [Actinoplanes sp. ATCC 53533]